MEIDELRKRVRGEEFDYQLLSEILRDYSKPRDKIRAWLKSGAIIRVKKGLYVFGESLARRPYSREVLANLMYGPSYVSMEFALQYYGLIPERVETLTSCALGRTRSFATPAGHFTYRQIPSKAYSIGVDRIELDGDRSFLMAVPEKALADKIQAGHGLAIASAKEFQRYLYEELRLEPAGLRRMQKKALGRIAAAYGSRRLRWLGDLR